jgi:hypothetical protein
VTGSSGATPTIETDREPSQDPPSGSVLAHAMSRTPGRARTSCSMASKKPSSFSSLGYSDPSGSTIIVNTLSAR